MCFNFFVYHTPPREAKWCPDPREVMSRGWGSPGGGWYTRKLKHTMHSYPILKIFQIWIVFEPYVRLRWSFFSNRLIFRGDYDFVVENCNKRGFHKVFHKYQSPDFDERFEGVPGLARGWELKFELPWERSVIRFSIFRRDLSTPSPLFWPISEPR